MQNLGPYYIYVHILRDFISLFLIFHVMNLNLPGEHRFFIFVSIFPYTNFNQIKPLNHHYFPIFYIKGIISFMDNKVH